MPSEMCRLVPFLAMLGEGPVMPGVGLAGRVALLFFMASLHLPEQAVLASSLAEWWIQVF